MDWKYLYKNLNFISFPKADVDNDYSMPTWIQCSNLNAQWIAKKTWNETNFQQLVKDKVT